MRALALEYHDVVERDAFDESGFPGAGPASYKLTRQDFEAHLAAIAQRITRAPTTALDWLGSSSSDIPLFITFDDGGVSAHRRIADALERHGWRGHFFVTAGRLGTPTFLSASEARELRDRGHIIGSHSYSHPARMGGLTRDRLVDEWRQSIDVLANALGEAVTTASVPGGFYTRPVGESAAEAGLKVLFTSMPSMRCEQLGDCRIVGRYTLRRWSTPNTAAALASGQWRARASQAVIFGGLHLLRTIAGDHYTRLRQQFWARRR
jgi:peptidoglycan/xylan/chitin deacetylase (PgdA/CDA1 family)